MGGGEGGNLGSGGEAPGGIFKIITPDGLCQPDDVTPEGVVVCLVYKPWCWSYLFYAGAALREEFLPALFGEVERSSLNPSTGGLYGV